MLTSKLLRTAAVVRANFVDTEAAIETWRWIDGTLVNVLLAGLTLEVGRAGALEVGI